ncbi:MAG: CIA30 family protein [Pseudomonadota bacterium]
MKNLRLIPLFDGFNAAGSASWAPADDRIMGGESVAQIRLNSDDGCMIACLSGQVSLAHGGGFVQMKWPLDSANFNWQGIVGIYLETRGNGERYNLHLRTRQLALPWQSFRHSFVSNEDWQTHFLPFAEFQAYRTTQALQPAKSRSIGIVAIGRAFQADVCVRQLGFYMLKDESITPIRSPSSELV